MSYRINPQLADRIYKRLPALLEKESVPGIALVLIRAAEVVHSIPLGVRSRLSQEPITEDTLFEAASLSKPVFAYAALKLHETGNLDLDTPLASYLPEPYLPDEPRFQLLTMRHVLSHTTGFPNWRPNGQALKMHFTPGERFSYSGEGYMYLPTVVRQITGQEPAGYIYSNLLKPLGMEHSRFVLNHLNDLPLAIGHNEQGEAKEKYLWREMNAAASLHCSAVDFGKFMCAVMRPSPDNPAHLSPATTQAMLTPQVQVNHSPSWDKAWPKPEFQTNALVSWGLGWGIQHTSAGDALWHWGDNGNYRAFAIGYPEEGEGLVFLTNGRHGQRVINHLLRDTVGGEYPGLDWLSG